MAMDEIYLTVDKNPSGPGCLAVISRGQPQLGDEDVVILDCGVFPSKWAARKWYRRVAAERPWETRN